MKSLIRTILLGGLSLLAFSALTVGVASAAAPEFSPTVNSKGKDMPFTIAAPSTTFYMKADKLSFTCTSASGNGEITGAKTAGGIGLTLKHCTGVNSSKEECGVNSPGRAGGEVQSNALAGTLGKVKTTLAPSGVGLSLASGTKGSEVVFELEGSCLFSSPMKVEGSVIGAVANVGVSQRLNEVIFAAPEGAQKIREFEGGEEQSLKAFGVTMALEANDALTFEEPVTVS